VPRDRSNGRDLLRRPKRKLSLTTGYRFANGARIGGEVLLSSTRLDILGFDPVTFQPVVGPLAGYGIVNLNASYPVWRGFTLEGRIENLFDKDYELISGYNTTPFAVFATLRYQR
jgi:vitamin B12 transporter